MSVEPELSDSPQYTIKAVSAQTGVREVTLRAWERRYRLVRPRRSGGNYRLYSERDIAALRWVKGRLDDGVTISVAAAELTAMRRSGHLPTLAPLPNLEPPTLVTTTPPDLYARRLFEALSGHDEATAEAIMREAHALYDVPTICLSVIAPCLVTIGEAWERGDLRISTEHFASTYLRGRLSTLMQAYPARRDAPRILVGCADGEHHEIGGLMLALLLRRNGYRVEYLGADVPTRDLLAYVRDDRPDMVCLSAGAAEPARELAAVQAGLARLRPRPRFGYGGRVFNLRPALREQTPGTFLGEDAAEASARLRQLLPIAA